MSLYITHTQDMELIRLFVVQPEIFSKNTEDGMTPDQYTPHNNYESFWLLAIFDFKIVGVCRFELNNSTMVTMHPAVLKTHSPQYGREIMRCFIKWMVQQSSSIKKIMAWVPHCFPLNKNCALRLGFEIEGISKKSFRKNDRLEDQWILGRSLNGDDSWLS